MVPAVVLAGLVLCAGFSRELGRGGAALLAAVSVLWLILNGPVEGVVLIEFSAGHGLTGADLAGVAGLSLAACRGFADRARRSAGTGRGADGRRSM